MKKIKEQYYQKLDTYIEMIPLTVDSVFKAVMQINSNVFKRFLIETLDLNIKPEESKVIFLDKELIKDNYKEKGKIVDLNVKINEKLLVTVEVNRVRFESIKERNKLYLEKLRTMQLEIGDEYNILDSKYIYQLNLNAKDNYKGKV